MEAVRVAGLVTTLVNVTGGAGGGSTGNVNSISGERVSN